MKAIITGSGASETVLAAEFELSITQRQRFEYSGVQDDLLAAHETQERFAQGPLPQSLDQADILSELGHTTMCRYHAGGSLKDVESCIALQREALSVHLAASSYPFPAKHRLAAALVYYHMETGDLSSLHEAIAINRKNLIELGPLHRDRDQPLELLGVCLGLLYQNTDNVERLDESLVAQKAALKALDTRHPRHKRLRCNYATTLRMKSGKLGDMQALEEAIQILRDCTSVKDERYKAIIMQLAFALGERYDAAGIADDLDEAVSLLRESLTLQPPGHLRRARILNNLANRLRGRYQARGLLVDLPEATELHREAVASCVSGSNEHTRFVLNSCNTLIMLCEATGSLTPLNDGIILCENMLHAQDSRITEQDMWRFLWQTTAELHRKKYELCRSTQDLLRALECYEHSLASLPSHSIMQHECLLGLATALRHSSSLSVASPLSDAERALLLLKQITEHLPVGHTDRVTALFELSQLSLVRNSHTYNPIHCMDYLIQALSDHCQSALVRLRNGMEVLSNVAGDPTFTSAAHAHDLLRAHRTMISLLPLAACFGINIEARLRSLRQSDTLAVRGASLALGLDDPRLAVELLEQGRAVFWMQHLRLRSDLDDVPPVLAAELHRTARLLDQSSLSDNDIHVDTEVSQKEKQATKQRQLGEKFEQLVAQARAEPGLERFLLPQTFHALSTVSENSPLVILIADQSACYAIVLSSSQRVAAIHLNAVSLPTLNTLSQTMESTLRRGRRGMRSRAVLRITKKSDGNTVEGVLNVLWITVAQTLVSALDLKVSPTSTTFLLTMLSLLRPEV